MTWQRYIKSDNYTTFRCLHFRCYRIQCDILCRTLTKHIYSPPHGMFLMFSPDGFLSGAQRHCCSAREPHRAKTPLCPKTLHCRSALNIKHKTQNTTHSCRVFSEKTGSCGGRNLERKKGGSELRKAGKTAVMTGSDRWDAAIGILSCPHRCLIAAR